LFVTNNISLLPQVDKVIVIENGSIVEMGSYEALIKNQNNLFANLVVKQKQVNKEDAAAEEKKGAVGVKNSENNKKDG
jgi:ABC-type transport system involved in cytochrome bd biosynthesis fused ATPase/permease subunit